MCYSRSTYLTLTSVHYFCKLCLNNYFYSFICSIHVSEETVLRDRLKTKTLKRQPKDSFLLFYNVMDYYNKSIFFSNVTLHYSCFLCYNDSSFFIFHLSALGIESKKYQYRFHFLCGRRKRVE